MISSTLSVRQVVLRGSTALVYLKRSGARSGCRGIRRREGNACATFPRTPLRQHATATGGLWARTLRQRACTAAASQAHYKPPCRSQPLARATLVSVQFQERNQQPNAIEVSKPSGPDTTWAWGANVWIAGLKKPAIQSMSLNAERTHRTRCVHVAQQGFTRAAHNPGVGAEVHGRHHGNASYIITLCARQPKRRRKPAIGSGKQDARETGAVRVPSHVSSDTRTISLKGQIQVTIIEKKRGKKKGGVMAERSNVIYVDARMSRYVLGVGRKRLDRTDAKSRSCAKHLGRAHDSGALPRVEHQGRALEETNLASGASTPQSADPLRSRVREQQPTTSPPTFQMPTTKTTNQQPKQQPTFQQPTFQSSNTNNQTTTNLPIFQYQQAKP